MRRRAASLALAALSAGCATSGPEGGRDQAIAGSECARVASLAAAGEHKPAVDLFDELRAAGGGCPAPVAQAAAGSRELLGRADDQVRAALAARDAGDLAAARRRLGEALEIYPRYYWVQKLESELGQTADREVEALRERAAAELAAGRAEEAVAALERASALPGGAARVSAELVAAREALVEARLSAAYEAQRNGRLEAAVEEVRKAVAAGPDGAARDRVVEFGLRLGQKLFAAGSLVDARAVWTAVLSLAPGDPTLRQFLEQVETRLEKLERIGDAPP